MTQLTSEDVRQLQQLVSDLRGENKVRASMATRNGSSYGTRAASPSQGDYGPQPHVQGVDWFFQQVSRPLFGQPIVSQLLTSVAAGASASLSITPLSGQWRFVLKESFGNTPSNTFNVNLLLDDLTTVGNFRVTSDILSEGLTKYVTESIGPIRKKLTYTFTNIGASAANLEFTSAGITTLSSLPANVMHMIAADLRGYGIVINEAQFSDVIRGSGVVQF